MAAGVDFLRPHQVRRWVATLALVTLTLACVQNDGSRNPLAGMISVGVEDERAVGFEADREIQAQIRKNGLLIEDPLVLAFIHELGQTMVANLGDQPFTYRFRVISDRQLNAFALPGGAIYFNSGTILSAGSLREVAGVMAHEIAHVKGRHYARMREAATIPSVLAQLAGIAATAATGQGEPLVIAQALNVALQLSYTREFEAEADTLATAFLARGGYPPDSVVPFFERIVREQDDRPSYDLPPYLFSHPAVESRIATARARAENVTVTGTTPPQLERAFRAAQYRLALLDETGRTELRQSLGAPEPKADGILKRADSLVKEDQRDEAIATLTRAIQQFPGDPRLHYRQGELLEESGRMHEALGAFQQAAVLDPTVALNFYRLGRVHKELGQTIQATFFMEQALRRFERKGTLQKKAEQSVQRLVFPVITKGGLADGEESIGADSPVGESREQFGAADTQIFWWGWISPPYVHRREEISVRWFDPSGALVQEGTTERLKRPRAGAALPLTPEISSRHGIWRVEARLDEDLIDRRTFRMAPARKTRVVPTP